MDWLRLLPSLVAWLDLSLRFVISETVVNSVGPSRGSLKGETRLTVSGSGFAADQFNFGDGKGHVGNRVDLVSSTQSINCPVHKDGSHELQIMCYTPPMVEDEYHVRVTIDNEPVPASEHCRTNPDSCKFRPSDHHTPKISYVEPRSGPPGSMIKIVGKLITSRYGSNLAASTNGREEKLLRVYVGGQPCVLKDPDTNEFYGLELDNDGTSWWGYMICKLQGSFVGHLNASFIVEGAFGRSMPADDILRVFANGKIGMFQSYAEIHSVSPSVGSTEGRLRLSVHGKNFDETSAFAKVKVGGTECAIVEPVEDTLIVCETAAEPQTTPTAYAGNRGLILEFWNETYKSNLEDIWSLDSTAADYILGFADEAYFKEEVWDNYVSRLHGYFVPPHDGNFKFYIKADDAANLYFSLDGPDENKTKIAYVPSYSRNYFQHSEQESQLFTLSGGQNYYFEVLHREGGITSSVQVAVRDYTTKFINRMTGTAKQEQQTISFTSTTVRETQNVTFVGFTNMTSVYEVQEMLLTSDNGLTADGKFRLGMNSVFTAPLSALASASDVRDALEGLPGLSPITIAVEQEAISGGTNFTITFKTDSGDLPDLEVYLSGPAMNFTVTEITAGVPSLELVALQLAGVPSPTFSPTASAAEVATAVEIMVGARCPSEIVSGADDFEGSDDYSEQGTQTFDSEAYCGRASLKNPNYLYKVPADTLGKSLSTDQLLCFAYKGRIESYIKLKYTHSVTTDGRTTNEEETKKFDHVFSTEYDRWDYTCVNMLNMINNNLYSNIRLEEASITRSSGQEDIYVDVVFIGKAPTTSDIDHLDVRRLLPARPRGALITDFTVSSLGSGTFEITLVALNCAYDFPLFEAAQSEVASGSPNPGSEFAAYNLTNGVAVGQVIVQRVASASPPIEGVFGATFNGISVTDIPANATAEDLRLLLETIDDIGWLTVSRDGDCKNFAYTITFDRLPGDQPLLQVDGSELTGISVAVAVTTNYDGSLWYDPIPGDMLRTDHDTPQVVVHINDITTKCSGNCSFQWSAGHTPSVTSVTPTSGDEGTQITISGTDFHSFAANNTVFIKGVPCNVTAATDTSITCNVGNGPIGTFQVMVIVNGLGLAKHSNGPVTFEYTCGITSISPASSSLGGGLTLSVFGFGFGQDATVTVDGEACPVQIRTPKELQCTIPKSTATTTSVVNVNVTNEGIILTLPASFTYNSSITPSIWNVSTSHGKVEGGTIIVISGSDFGSSAFSVDSVKVGDKPVEIVSYADDLIEGVLPALGPGEYRLNLFTASGYALDSQNSFPIISFTLRVDNVFPSRGSLFGGTRLTLTGVGFSTNNTHILLKAADHECEPESATPTEIICVILDTGKVHHISNQGIDKTHGIGYAWDRPKLTVNVGDYIRWTLSTPEWVNGIAHGVEETDDVTSDKPKEGGFKSRRTANGVYQYRFTVPGVYPYWSGYVDMYDIISYRGIVIVEPLKSYLVNVSLQIAGFEADYNVTSGVVDPTDSSACPGTNDVITGCNGTEPTDGTTDYFTFAFWDCSSPIVDSFSINNGTTSANIVITGYGFSTTPCQNDVAVGDASCVVSASNETTIICSVDPSSSPPVGIPQEWAVSVSNLGYGLVAVAEVLGRTYSLLPEVTSISPMQGSTAGGTLLTLQGSGFQGAKSDIEVLVGGYQCTLLSVTYLEVTCLTPASVAGSKSLVLNVYINDNPIAAECGSLVCEYEYSGAATPQVMSVTPGIISGPNSTLAIVGSLFGTVDSNVSVTIAGVDCSITYINDTDIECDIGYVPVGSYDLVVRVDGKGSAEATGVQVTVDPVISSISPQQGSSYGGTEMLISGSGFVTGSTTVTIDGNDCNVTEVTLWQVKCTTPAHTVSSVSVNITSNGIDYTSLTFVYADAVTPAVASVSPLVGLAGDTLTITGSNFGMSNSDNTVMVGIAECAVTSSSMDQINCTAGAAATGSYSVIVHVAGKGLSNDDKTFSYQLSVSTIFPTTGSIAGGQLLILSGTGFDEAITTVTVCGDECVAQSVTPTQFNCTTPPGTGTCDVVITANNLVETKNQAYTYDSSVTPSVTSISPRRGGTAGGTTLMIDGSGFGTSAGDIAISIAGSECTVSSVSDTQIICVTGAHSPSVKAKVQVSVATNGIASQENADFEYVDVWSSIYTWGGGSVPGDGEIVVIQTGQTVVLDTDTAMLKMLLIKGGKLIFDEKDVELKAENVLITENGLLQVGTEDEPFQHKAIITLYGQFRSKELPIYGTKTVAVREGILDLHGKPRDVMWTRLDQTASATTSTITVQNPVDWVAGDQIVIASSGHHHSQKENEMHTISAVSGDKRTLTLSKALEYDHLGVTETLGGVSIDFRAEIGLLTHNVVVRGTSDVQWEEKIEKCPEGFDTGEFAVQTCFQGRFGEEMGSDQFGGQIMIHAPRKDEHLAIGRIDHVEVTHAGQAFRLGRYPIHFHLNGDMSSSYVRSCSIHHTFNRAVNIHGSHHTLVERNVVYDIMGGALFLEDGIETNNTFQYNLGVFVRASSSLLNDDITPATFWVTNPNNQILHNAAAGGSHFGYWYRMLEHPDGPSFTRSVCPRKMTLGRFYNNTAHSFGQFGFWVFETYFPVTGGSCGSSTPLTVVFEKFIAWNCDKGAETVNSGALQFDNFILVNNRLAGYEGKMVHLVPQFTDNSPMINNSLIVGHTPQLSSTQQGCTRAAVVLPYGSGFEVRNTIFVNFDRPECAAFRFARITGTCNVFCGGYNYRTRGLTFDNSPNIGVFDWLFEGVVEDVDGTLSGVQGGKVITTTGTLPRTCTPFSAFSKNLPASVCPPNTKFHRFSFNHIHPSSLEGKNVILENEYGTSMLPFALKRITHKPGWMVVLVNGQDYKVTFENADQVTNISFSGTFHQFEDAADWVTVTLKLDGRPDRYMIDGQTNRNSSTTDINPQMNVNGDWYFDNVNYTLKFLVSGNDPSRRKRGISVRYNTDKDYNFKAFRCYFRDCLPPPDPNLVPPVSGRPAEYSVWSADISWKDIPEGWGGNKGNGTYGLPVDGDNVLIPEGTWMVADTRIPSIDELVLYGTLELDHGPNSQAGHYRNFVINATYIYIRGGRLIIGWETDPFLGQALILLRGNHLTPVYPTTDGPEVGAKVIGVFGGLDLHGADVGTVWTTLAQTANIGDRQIVLAKPVNWTVGSYIVIAPSEYNMWETETFEVQAISSDQLTLTLDKTLASRHIVHEETINGEHIKMAAEVGLLSRNIRVEGEGYSDLQSESFGARVLIGITADTEESYVGYARLSNVEFYHTGQDGWSESYDPRYSVAFVGAGTVGTLKPSYIRMCSFHDGFSPAIGVFGTNGLPVEDNVIHHTVEKAIETTSDDTQLRRNLVVLNIWSGSYQDRRETKNIRYPGAIEAIKSSNLVLDGNVVSGSERIAFHVPGESCDETNAASWTDNSAHSSLVGVGVFITDGLSGDCLRFSNFTIWRCPDFGIYYNSEPSVLMTKNVLIENRVAAFPMVVGPSSTAHAMADKTVKFRDSLLVGKTSSYDCSATILDGTDDNIALSGQGRSWTIPGGSFSGVAFPSFTAGGNSAPEKPFKNIMAYNSIKGLMTIEDVTFAHFEEPCDAKKDFAIVTNPSNDDGIHPIESQRLTFVSVPDTNKIFIHRPNVGKINSADCVDMDCDGLKKAFLKDEDGSLLGSPGAVIPQSEYEWDGEDKRRGLGDYRIPKDMLTELDGTRIPVARIAPEKGIIRNDACVWHNSWQAYECHDLDYEMLIIESMDSDTETRRLSPVAILGDGYLDLINGPQDHGWCSGYTCRKRLSTFMAVVATGKEYEIYFTSTSPQKLRLLLLNSNSTQTIRLGVYFSRPERLDVYHNGVYVPPKNGGTVNGRYILKAPNTPGEYMPDVALDPAGTNFLDRDYRILYFVVQGPLPVEIKTVPVIIVSFSLPALTVDEFFGENIIHNLAQFLDVPPSKVRIVSIVNEKSVTRRSIDEERQHSGRYRRAADDTVLTVEIGDEATQDMNDTANSSLPYQTLVNATEQLVNEIQLGNISDVLNTTINGVAVAEPAPQQGDPGYDIVGPDPLQDRPIVGTLHVHTQPEPLHEGTAFSVQPMLQLLDSAGQPINAVGTSNSKWEVTVLLFDSGTGHPATRLEGNLTVPIDNGWANFSDISITHLGSGYILKFYISDPVEAENITAMSDSLTVLGRPIKAGVFAMNQTVVENRAIDITLQLLDKVTNEEIQDIAWRGHVWNVSVSLSMPELYYGDLVGMSETSFDSVTGLVLFSELRFTSAGRYYINFNVTSDPSDYHFQYELEVDVMSLSHLTLVVEWSKELQIKFDENYDLIVGQQSKYFGTMVANYYSYMFPGVLIKGVLVNKGSIIVTFTLDGSESDVNETIFGICDDIQKQQMFTFNGKNMILSPQMTVNGANYYGVSCGPLTAAKPFPPAAIAGIVVGALILIIVVAIFFFWKFKVQPKSKTTDLNTAHLYGYKTQEEIEEILFREKTFTSLSKERLGNSPVPPLGTSMQSWTRENTSEKTGFDANKMT